MGDVEDVRFGVFLVPDARTSAAVTDITRYLQAQFGLVSARRFPPHITLVGSLPLGVSEDQLLTEVEQVAAAHAPIELTNAGPTRLGEAVVVFDVHHDSEGQPNQPLVELAVAVTDAVGPLLRPVETLPADIRDQGHWRGHFSLASHELIERQDLREEVEEFIDGLDVSYPDSFLTTRLAVYRLRHQNWSGRWWNSFEWAHVRSFTLTGSPASRVPG